MSVNSKRLDSAPSEKALENKLESKKFMDTKELRKRSLMSGASIEKIQRALITHEN